MKVRTAKRRLRQTGSTMMGVLFCLSIALGQIGACGCGPSCLHVLQFDTPAAAATTDSKSVGEAPSCCPKPAAKTPEQQPGNGAPCEDDSGECGCPVMSVDADEQGAAFLSSPALLVIKPPANSASPLAATSTSHASALAGSFAKPCRGSPLPSPPINILNATFVI